MKIVGKTKCYIVIGLTILPLVIAGAALLHSNNTINPSKASQFNAYLNIDNAPELTAGEGAMTDEKGVRWEYHNASDYLSGHVSLNHQGYVGVSSSTQWGYTEIDSLTVNFTAGENGELWLLTSIDGVNWEEGEILTSNTETHAADNWRFVRFYYWDEEENTADITSIHIGYGCTGVSSVDDSDLSNISNVRKHDDLDATEEYENVSPRLNSTKALRLTTTSGRSTSSTKHQTIFNIAETTLKKLQGYKIEFDYYYARKRDPKKAPGYPSLRMANATGTVGLLRSYDENIDAFTCEDIGDGWWHMECYITYIMQAAEHKLSTVVTGIILYDEAIYVHDRDGQEFTGYVIIDNLFLTNHERSGTVSNSWTTVKIGATGNDRYFIRENFVGSIHETTYSCSDTSKATLFYEKKNNNKLCFIQGLEEGTIVVTITYKLGYDRETVIVHTKTLSVEY